MRVKAPELAFKPEQQSLLVVDDHPHIRKAMVRLLRDMGFVDIQEAHLGSEAIELLKKEAFDLVLLDLYLDEVTGFNILEHIRNRDVAADIPVILVTGEASKEEIVKAVDLGANDYIVKPFKAEDLQNKIIKTLNTYNRPSPYLKLLRQAERHYLAKQYRQALHHVETALEMNPDTVRARYLKALISIRQGQLNEAIKLLEENIEINDSFYKSYATLGDIYLRLGKKSEAMEVISQELALNPRQPKRQTQLGLLYLEHGHTEEAIDRFREALRENVHFKTALFGMAKAYALMDNIEKSVYYYKRIRRYFPQNTKALESLVKVCLDAGQEKLAEFSLKDEKNRNKEALDTYLVLAKFYSKIGDQDQAFAVLDDLFSREPNHIEGLKLKAALHMKHHHTRQAIDIYLRILKLDPSVTTRIQFADILFHAKNYKAAIKQLHLCYRLKNAPHSDILLRLATAYLRTGQNIKAYLTFHLLEKRRPLPPSVTQMAAQAEATFKQKRKTYKSNPAA